MGKTRPRDYATDKEVETFKRLTAEQKRNIAFKVDLGYQQVCDILKGHKRARTEKAVQTIDMAYEELKEKNPYE